jgi:hypothetical protein
MNRREEDGMKLRKLMVIGLVAGALCGIQAQAGEYDQVILQTATATTSATPVTVSEKMAGEIQEIMIDIPSTLTGTVVVVTGDGQTLLTKTGATGDAWYRVAMSEHGTTGAITETNAIKPVVVGTISAQFKSFNTTGACTVKVNVKK